MKPQIWKDQARKHWKEFQPRRYKELKAAGRLEAALDFAVEQSTGNCPNRKRWATTPTRPGPARATDE